MLFNSLQFLIFFPAVTVVFFLLAHRHRCVWLLAASYYFYMCWVPYYIVLVLISTVVDYVAALRMTNTQSPGRKFGYLIFSLCTNLGLLFTFKYFDFFNASLRDIFGFFDAPYAVPALDLLLPIGISFYTFQTLSYTIDVYRGEQKPERNFGVFALYVTFFPQLVAGPIERPGRLLPQFRQKKVWESQRVADGLKLMVWGFFMKVVIADRLAMFVNAAYNDPTDHGGISLTVATVFFAFQIFCDFSGYTNIAIGAAQVLGFNLMENFRRPYFAKSIRDFWRRWHISLSTWFRDYVYFPLGSNTRVKMSRSVALVVVFLASGLWHGANWTFVVWGGLHGFYALVGRATETSRRRLIDRVGLSRSPTLLKCWQVLVTFGLVCVAWVFFRANTVSDGYYIVTHLATGWHKALSLDTLIPAVLVGQHGHEFVIAVCAIGFMVFVQILQRHGSLRARLSERPVWFRWGMYYAIIIAILMLGKFDQQQFIYFQF